MITARTFFVTVALATAALAVVGCQLDPQNPPYVGCSPPCASDESCYRGYCVHGDPRPPADNGVTYVPALDAATDASADGG